METDAKVTRDKREGLGEGEEMLGALKGLQRIGVEGIRDHSEMDGVWENQRIREGAQGGNVGGSGHLRGRELRVEGIWKGSGSLEGIPWKQQLPGSPLCPTPDQLLSRDGAEPGVGRRRAFVWVEDWREDCILTHLYPQSYVPTVFENYTASFEIDKRRIELNMWDTSGSQVPRGHPDF